MRLVNRADRAGTTTKHQDIQIIIDPKTANLDRVVHDVLEINRIAMKKFPPAKLRSITIDDYFAVVDMTTAKNPAATGATIRLYKIYGVWSVKGCAFLDEMTSGNAALASGSRE